MLSGSGEGGSLSSHGNAGLAGFTRDFSAPGTYRYMLWISETKLSAFSKRLWPQNAFGQGVP